MLQFDHLFTQWISRLRQPEKLRVWLEGERVVVNCADYATACEVWKSRHHLSELCFDLVVIEGDRMFARAKR